jgi:hypothetical protein
MTNSLRGFADPLRPYVIAIALLEIVSIVAMGACWQSRAIDHCRPGAMRCNDRTNTPQACSQDQRWVNLNEDCTRNQRVCCLMPNYFDQLRLIPACMKPEYCVQDAGSHP